MITIDEAKVCKVQAEVQILQVLKIFVEKTGLTIESIDLTQSRRSFEPDEPIKFTITVKL